MEERKMASLLIVSSAMQCKYRNILAYRHTAPPAGQEWNPLHGLWPELQPSARLDIRTANDAGSQTFFSVVSLLPSLPSFFLALPFFSLFMLAQCLPYAPFSFSITDQLNGFPYYGCLFLIISIFWLSKTIYSFIFEDEGIHLHMINKIWSILIHLVIWIFCQSESNMYFSLDRK